MCSVLPVFTAGRDVHTFAVCCLELVVVDDDRTGARVIVCFSGEVITLSENDG